MLKITEILTEYRKNPIGIDIEKPRFSWKLESEANDVIQEAYQIAVKNGGNITWDSGKIESNQSVLVEYSGEKLLPMTKYTVNVIAWDNQSESASSSSSFDQEPKRFAALLS